MSSPTVLVVDDDQASLMLISRVLQKNNYQVFTAHNGLEAIEVLKLKHGSIDAILLDWVMPKLDGIEFLKKHKEIPTFSAIPVIMQTSKNSSQDIAEGIRAGAYYYLIKPIDHVIMLTVLHTAISEHGQFKELLNQIKGEGTIGSLMLEGTFQFRTLKEAFTLARWLGKSCPSPKNVAIGLVELFTNAIEHGNLNLSYEKKSELMMANLWEIEIQHLLDRPEHSNKHVELRVERLQHEVRFYIKDQGKGFDFKKYLEMDVDRIFDPHGRGVAMAKNLFFDELEFIGSGNEVLAIAKI